MGHVTQTFVIVFGNPDLVEAVHAVATEIWAEHTDPGERICRPIGAVTPMAMNNWSAFWINSTGSKDGGREAENHRARIEILHARMPRGDEVTGLLDTVVVRCGEDHHNFSATRWFI